MEPAAPDRSRRSGRGARLALLGILASGLALRLLGLGYGLPHFSDWDEPTYVKEALRLLDEGTLRHTNLEHGALAYFVQAAASFAAEKATGGERTRLAWSRKHLGNVPVRDIAWGRTAVALFGAASVWLAFLVGRKVGGDLSGLASAAILAASPLACAMGQIVHDDSIAVFFVLLALLAILELDRRGGARGAALAGLACGAALGAKYTSLPILLPLVAAALGPGTAGRAVSWRLERTGLALACAFAGFLATSPATFLDAHLLLSQLGEARLGSFTGSLAEGRIEVLRWGLDHGMGRAAFVLALAGGAAALARWRRVELLVLLFPLAATAMLAPFRGVRPHYLLPALGPYAVLAGLALASLHAKLCARGRTPGRARAALAVLLVVGVAGPPAWVSAARAAARTHESPSERAARYIEGAIPAGSRILLERFTVALPEGRYRWKRVERAISLRDGRWEGFDAIVLSSVFYTFPRDADEYARLLSRCAVLAAFVHEPGIVPTTKPDSPGPEILVVAPKARKAGS